MQCPGCGGENSTESGGFCAHCGQPLTRCGLCGAGNLPRFRHCVACGAFLAQRDGSDNGAGERKYVTVLFADISDSLAMIQHSDPEDARVLFDRTVEVVTAIVRSHGGTITRVLGDGVMALFGAPVAQAQHAVRATKAALSVQQAIGALNSELESQYRVRIRMHLGIDTGEVVVRYVSTDLHAEYDAVGRTVHVASRIQALAPAGTVRISAETARQVAGFVKTRSLGLVNVKGLADPIEIFEPVDAEGATTPFELSISRGLSPLLGREHEMAELLAAVERVWAGSGELWSIVGDAGTGKSRLTHEVRARLQDRGWRAIEAACTMESATTNLAPVVTLLKAFYGIRDSDSSQAVRDCIASGQEVPSADSVTAAAVLSVLGLAEVDRDWKGLDPPLRRDAVDNLLPALFLPASRRLPIAIILQDLQWATPETIAMLDKLVQVLPGHRILVLATFRPEWRNPWRGRKGTHELGIEPLPQQDARALIDSLIGKDPSLAEVQALVLRRSAGNPFFIEESVRSIAESGAIATEDGRAVLAGSIDRVTIPHTIHSMLSSRIDQLPPADKSLLQCIAAIGGEFTVTFLHAVRHGFEWRQSLARLLLAGFVVHAREGEAEAFVVKHPLIEEVAYGGLLRTQRRTLHREILGAMEELYASRTAEMAERLAEHARRGEVWSKCVIYLRVAAELAYGRSANAEAVRLLQDALEVCAGLPPDPDRNRLFLDLSFDLRNALLLVGEIGKILKTLADAEEVAAELGDASRSVKLGSYMTHAFWATGDCRRALTHGWRALRLSRGVDRAISMPARYHVALVMSDLGRYTEANRRLGQLIEEVDTCREERFGLNAPLFVLGGSYLVRSLAEVGSFDASRRHAERVSTFADSIGQTFAEAMIRLAGGYGDLVRGEAQPAIEALSAAHARFLLLKNVTMSTVTEGFLGYAFLLQGDLGAAEAWLDRSVSRAETIGVLSQQPLRLAFLAECRLRLRDKAAAFQLVDKAVRLAEQQLERGSQAWTLCLRGRLLRESREDCAQALAAIEAAATLAARSAMAPLAAICLLEKANCLFDLGRPDEAQLRAAEAVASFQRLDMPAWRARAAAGGAGGIRLGAD